MTSDVSTIAVACAADGQYALPLAVMLNSVGSHAAPNTSIEAYVLDDGVSTGDRRKVAASLPRNVHLEWRKPASALRNLPTWGRMPITVYQKLTIDEWLPEKVHRAIWLDCDVVVLKDVGPLWGSGMGPNVVLAAQDQRIAAVSSRFGVAAWRTLGLPAGSKYFNTGVLVVDLTQWRRHEVRRRSLEYISAYGDRVYFWDQEALNAVLAGKWGQLDPRWNWHPSLNRVTGSGGLQPEPWILHYSGNLKPWMVAGNDPPRALYHSYVDRTAWAGWRPACQWQGRALAWYETSRLRRLLYPTERMATTILRNLTRRHADMTHEGAERARTETIHDPGNRYLSDHPPRNRAPAPANGAAPD